MFSLTDAVLLRPLQFGNEARVVQIWERRPGFSITNDPVAPGNFADWKARSHAFDKVGAVGNTILSITGDGRPEQVEANQMTANLLSILGVKPLLGRNFLPEEDQPGGSHVALISARLWQTRYGADPRIIGRTIRLDGVPFSVAGVMPFGFSFYQSSQVWVPLALTPELLRDRDDHYLMVFGLLRGHTSVESASRDLLAISKRLQQEYPRANTGVIASPIALREQFVGKTASRDTGACRRRSCYSADDVRQHRRPDDCAQHDARLRYRRQEGAWGFFTCTVSGIFLGVPSAFAFWCSGGRDGGGCLCAAAGKAGASEHGRMGASAD